MKDKTLKKVIELAEGFEVVEDVEGIGDVCNYDRSIMSSPLDEIHEYCHYPIILRRAVEGWNNKHPIDADIVIDSAGIIWGKLDDTCGSISYDDYPKTEYLTPCEQAIEACLIELLEES